MMKRLVALFLVFFCSTKLCLAETNRDIFVRYIREALNEHDDLRSVADKFDIRITPDIFNASIGVDVVTQKWFISIGEPLLAAFRTKEHLKAIVAHEVGHYLKGHLKQFKLDGSDKSSRYMYAKSRRFENEANDYAFNHLLEKNYYTNALWEVFAIIHDQTALRDYSYQGLDDPADRATHPETEASMVHAWKKSQQVGVRKAQEPLNSKLREFMQKKPNHKALINIGYFDHADFLEKTKSIPTKLDKNVLAQLMKLYRPLYKRSNRPLSETDYVVPFRFMGLHAESPKELTAALNETIGTIKALNPQHEFYVRFTALHHFLSRKNWSWGELEQGDLLPHFKKVLAYEQPLGGETRLIGELWESLSQKLEEQPRYQSMDLAERIGYLDSRFGIKAGPIHSGEAVFESLAKVTRSSDDLVTLLNLFPNDVEALKSPALVKNFGGVSRLLETLFANKGRFKNLPSLDVGQLFLEPTVPIETVMRLHDSQDDLTRFFHLKSYRWDNQVVGSDGYTRSHIEEVFRVRNDDFLNQPSKWIPWLSSKLDIPGGRQKEIEQRRSYRDKVVTSLIQQSLAQRAKSPTFINEMLQLSSEFRTRDLATDHSPALKFDLRTEHIMGLLSSDLGYYQGFLLAEQWAHADKNFRGDFYQRLNLFEQYAAKASNPNFERALWTFLERHGAEVLDWGVLSMGKFRYNLDSKV